MAISNGPITQTAWVTGDITATEEFLSEHFGAGKWTRIPDVPFGPDTSVYRGAPADFTAHISLAYLGDMQLELIQPVRGESIYTEFLRRGGSGLHHICFEPADYDQALAAVATAGLEVVQSGHIGDLRFAYLDGAAAGVPFIELADVPDAMRAFYAQIKAGS